MRHAIHYLLALIVCVSLFAGCREASTHAPPIDTHPTENGTAPTVEDTISTDATEETETAPTTEEPSTPKETEEIWTNRFCSACGVWYEGIDLVDGVCTDCRNGTCFLCGGPNGPDHNCDDYPNVVCPNPDCDWGIYTTGVGIDGIICPKCGTRCI